MFFRPFFVVNRRKTLVYSASSPITATLVPAMFAHRLRGGRPTEAKEKNSAGSVWSARNDGGTGAPPASGAY
ncbi:MAG: hypothetical protein GY759_09790 [Chloroflexi bacterium]|nr:hypothetical protein [Chloroflexota bacterium]